MWIDVIKDELNTINKNNTCVKALQNLAPPKAKILPSRIMLKLNQDDHGDISKFKARHFLRVSFQSDAPRNASLKAPETCIEFIWLMLAISVSKGYENARMDIREAFPYSTLWTSENIWTRFPKIIGAPSANVGLVRRVKSRYGLCQAPILRDQFLTMILRKAGFRQLQYSDCLFIDRKLWNLFYIVSYVDDLLVIGHAKTYPVAEVNIWSKVAYVN